MLKKNIYSRITESIVSAYHDNNLDTAMACPQKDSVGKKIVAIITADPDGDLDWSSEYEPFGASQLTHEDQVECCDYQGICYDDEQDDDELCPSCGYDIELEDQENDDMEDLMIGGEVEDEEYSSGDQMSDIKDVLVDILHELRGDSQEQELDDEQEVQDQDEDFNPMFGDSQEQDSDEEEDQDDDEQEDSDELLSAKSDWASDEQEDSDEEDQDDEQQKKQEDAEEIVEDDQDQDFDWSNDEQKSC